ncbi:hypothetical protein BLNAU_6596 [Blattamonas nauphoetae]|uniref:Right handed beta helix domain-containing protein n=1 Tax=Blattamonas nauphoetae TaxID=2049346 RepID=A0ABQ9Y3L5_9EUKA|nr:hypothetical protein BLNAU_6596 [Blattamonas nauphoetae]
MYRGAMSVQSCTFSGIASSSEEAGAVYVLYPGQFNRVCFTANSSNFTSCSASQNGGAMFVSVLDATLINLCRFEHCSTTGESSTGGALRLGGRLWNGQVQYQFQLVDCVIADCKAATRGGGVHIDGKLELSVVGTKFERCEVGSESDFALGGGIGVNDDPSLKVERSQFIECRSRNGGGAVSFQDQNNLSISDTLVKDCYSGTTGAVCVIHSINSGLFSFLRVFFDGSSIGEDTTFFTSSSVHFSQDATKFTDVAIMSGKYDYSPTIAFDDCFTTTHPDSAGKMNITSFMFSLFLRYFIQTTNQER